jgi:hypothetical protein
MIFASIFGTVQIENAKFNNINPVLLNLLKSGYEIIPDHVQSVDSKIRKNDILGTSDTLNESVILLTTRNCGDYVIIFTGDGRCILRRHVEDILASFGYKSTPYYPKILTNPQNVQFY